MTPLRIVAIVLIALGVAALAYGGFSYTKETHQAKIGPIELSMKEKQEVNVRVPILRRHIRFERGRRGVSDQTLTVTRKSFRLATVAYV